MSETFGDTDRISCSHAALLLEKQFAEEPLSNRAEEGLRAHLAECRKCQRTVNWMSTLPIHADAHADKRFNTGLRSAYQTSMNKRAYLQHKEYRKRIAMAIVAAAVLIAAVFGQDWLASLSSPRGDAAMAPVDCLPVPPEETVPGVIMTYCEDAAPDARIENDGDVRVRLEGGTVGMLIDPNRPHKRRVAVETPQGEVRVKGTMFTVRVDAQRSQVEVFRGVVEFVPTASTEDALSVKAGQGADLGHRTVFALSSPKTAPIRQVLYEKERHRSTEQPPSPEEGRTFSKSPKTVAALDSSEPTELTSRSAPADQTTSVTLSSDARPGSAAPPKREVPTIDSLIHEAQSCLIARDWMCASSRYQGILKHYPKRPESTAALISLARIELRHLGMPKKALDHYRTYQKRAPGGPMAEEALFGIAATYRQLGKKDLEQATLRRFIEQFPSSSQIKRAHARLRQLGREKPRGVPE